MQSLIWSLQGAFPALGESKGTVVVVLPTTAMSGGSQYSLAAASFEAQRILMKATARQWGPSGIRVNAIGIAPESVLDDAHLADVHYLAPAALGEERSGEQRALDLVRAVEFLISGQSSGLTGQTVGVDGGKVAGPVSINENSNREADETGSATVPTPRRLVGRTAIVTGAGQGVGLGIAKRLAAEGANVVIAARRAKTGEPAAEEIRAAGGEAVCIVTDVTERAAGASVCRPDCRALRWPRDHGSQRRPGCCRCAPGWPTSTSIVGPASRKTAVWASFFCAQSASPHLKAAGVRGRLILISSPSGVEGSHTLPLYSPVKAAQRGLAKSLAREWGAFGITVNCIAPVAETPALQSAFISNPQLKSRLEGRTPLGRLGGSRTRHGAVAAFLASDDGSYVTGQTIVVDGGHFMGF